MSEGHEHISLAAAHKPTGESEASARQRIAAQYRDLARQCECALVQSISETGRAHNRKMAAYYYGLASRTERGAP